MCKLEEIKIITESIIYCPNTGVISWRKDRPQTHFKREKDHTRYMNNLAGKPVIVCKDGNGYLHFRLGYSLYVVHRVAFVCMNQSFPLDQVDHINGNRTDNRWENLRAVLRVLNTRNRKKPSNNTSGVTGVSWHKGKQKWSVRVCIQGKEKTLGSYEDLEEAKQIRFKFLEDNPQLGYTSSHGIR